MTLTKSEFMKLLGDRFEYVSVEEAKREEDWIEFKEDGYMECSNGLLWFKEKDVFPKVFENKFILDACCGCRMMWNDKKHPNTIYMDIRKEPKGFIKEQPNYEVNPDILGDFTNLPKEIKEMKFKLVVWDVPHFRARRLTGVFLKKFGGLNPETWQSDLTKGFNELWSVLEDYGILIFKFSDYHIKFKKALSLFPIKPLFFNSMNSMRNENNKSETRWFCFMKIPEVAEFAKKIQEAQSK